MRMRVLKANSELTNSRTLRVYSSRFAYIHFSMVLIEEFSCETFFFSLKNTARRLYFYARRKLGADFFKENFVH